MPAVLRYGLYLAIAYGILVLTVYLLQRRMLYFPDRQQPPDAYVKTLGLAAWPSAAAPFRGYIDAEPPAAARGTVIAFHGNAGAAWQRDYFVQALKPLGFRVILAEYPGYGGRIGEMNERSFVTDAAEAIRQTHAQFGDPIYLLGESMGAGVAAAVAGSPPVQLGGLILITPWDSLPDLAQTHYWYLPARFLTRDRYDSVSNLKGFQRPVAMAIAENDEVVPNRHSLRLYDAITAPKRLWRFKGAGHNSWPTDPGHPWWREALRFVASETNSPGGPQQKPGATRGDSG